MDGFGTLMQGLAAAFAGGGAASGWTVSVIVANAAFDGLDYNRADRQLKKVLLLSSTFQAVLLGIAAVLALLSGSIAAFVTCLMTALGFLTNIWTLAPRQGKRVTGVRENKKGKRVVAVALTLMVTVLACAGAALAAMGI